MRSGCANCENTCICESAVIDSHNASDINSLQNADLVSPFYGIRTFIIMFINSATDLHFESIERSPPLIPILSQLNPTVDACSHSVQQSPPLIHILSQLNEAHH